MMGRLSTVQAQDIGSHFGFDEVLIIGRNHAEGISIQPTIVSWGRTDKYRSWAQQLAYYFEHKLEQWRIADMDTSMDLPAARQRMVPPPGAAS